MEIEIVTFVVKGSMKLTVPTDWQEQIQVGSRSVALRRVFDLKLRGGGGGVTSDLDNYQSLGY